MTCGNGTSLRERKVLVKEAVSVSTRELVKSRDAACYHSQESGGRPCSEPLEEELVTICSRV